MILAMGTFICLSLLASLFYSDKICGRGIDGNNVPRLPICIPFGSSPIPSSSTDSGPGHLTTLFHCTVATWFKESGKSTLVQSNFCLLDLCPCHENVSRLACRVMWLSFEGELSVPRKGHPRPGSPSPTPGSCTYMGESRQDQMSLVKVSKTIDSRETRIGCFLNN